MDNIFMLVIRTENQTKTIKISDAEIGCLDYQVIKTLAATYELQDYLANRIARECLDEEE